MAGMSSESKVKKLRGSGGYIMASVTEEQQRKGNLGGPDLFLAPIGRIDSNKISKHYCNSCEKDYEGSPKIDYENPNEEVAENLVLVEKGKYLCNTCSSTIAEYREFKKPDQAGDVGLAKPDSGSQPPPSESIQENPANVESTESVQKPQQFESQPSEPPKVERVEPPKPPPVEPKKQPQPTVKSSPSSASINSVIGMEVFDENVKRVGTVKQMGVDSSQSVVLVVTKNDGSEVNIRWNQIKKIGEIILLGSQDSVSQTSGTSGFQCPSCGFDNKPGSKFCENCGSRI